MRLELVTEIGVALVLVCHVRNKVHETVVGIQEIRGDDDCPIIRLDV